MADEFKLGDVVRLRSADVCMTAVGVDPDGEVTVAYHTSRGVSLSRLPAEALEHAAVVRDLRPGERPLTTEDVKPVGTFTSRVVPWDAPPAEPRDVSDSLSYLLKLILEHRRDVVHVKVSSAPYRMFCATAYDQHGPTEARVGATELAALMVLATELGVFSTHPDAGEVRVTDSAPVDEVAELVKAVHGARPAVREVRRRPLEDGGPYVAWSTSDDTSLHQTSYGRTELESVQNLCRKLEVFLEMQTVEDPRPEPTGPGKTLDELAELLQLSGVVHLAYVDGEVVVGLPASSWSGRYPDLATAFEQCLVYVRTTREARAQAGGPTLG